MCAVPSIYLPTIMRRLANSRPTITVAGDTVAEILHDLVTTYPELKEHVYDDPGNLQRHMLIVLNGEDIRMLDGEQTTVADRDEVQLVPAMAGG